MTGPGDVERLAALALRAIRPRFEVWAVDHAFSVEHVDEDNPESKYRSLTTQAAFEGWCGAMFDSVD